jgi:hypothetical protein
MKYISLIYARHATRVLKLGVLETNDWKMLGIGQLECVSYGVVWRVLSYCVDIGSDQGI